MATENEGKTEGKNDPEIFKKICPYCNKPFHSLNERQLLFNYTSHTGSCKFKNENKKKVDGKK